MQNKRRGRRPLASKYPVLTAEIEASGMTYWQVAGKTGIRRIGQKISGHDRWQKSDIDALLKLFEKKYEDLFKEAASE